MSPCAKRDDIRHLAFLDGIRGLAAIQVVLGHAVIHYKWTLPEGWEFANLLFWLMSFARESVAVFIVLSGFCLMIPVVGNDQQIRGGFVGFINRRAWRILPPYFCALISSIVLVYLLIGNPTNTHWDVCLPVTVKAIVSHLLMIQDVFKDTSARINHAMWSVSVEWRIYFAFPIIVLLWRRRGAIIATGAAVAFSYALVRGIRSEIVNIGGYGICPQFLGLFAMGMFGAHVAYTDDRNWSKFRGKIPWRLALACFATLAILVRERSESALLPLPLYLRDYITGATAACLLVTVAINPTGRLGRTFSYPPFVTLGIFSYSLYLMHAPLMQVFSQYVLDPFSFSVHMNAILLIGIGTPIITWGCYCFYICCERPFLVYRKGVRT